MEEEQVTIDVDALNIAQPMSPELHVQCFQTVGLLVSQVEKNNLAPAHHQECQGK